MNQFCLCQHVCGSQMGTGLTVTDDIRPCLHGIPPALLPGERPTDRFQKYSSKCLLRECFTQSISSFTHPSMFLFRLHIRSLEPVRNNNKNSDKNINNNNNHPSPPTHHHPHPNPHPPHRRHLPPPLHHRKRKKKKLYLLHRKYFFLSCTFNRKKDHINNGNSKK